MTAFPLFLTSICCMNHSQNIFCYKQFFGYFKTLLRTKSPIRTTQKSKTSERAYPRSFAGDNIVFRKNLMSFNKKMLETPLIYIALFLLYQLYHFSKQCARTFCYCNDILCHKIAIKLIKNFLKVFLALSIKLFLLCS